MLVFLLTGLALVAGSAWLYVQAFSFRRRVVAERMAEIHRYGFQARPAPEGTAGRRRLRLLSRLDALAGATGGLVSDGGESELQRLLRSAGVYGLSPRKLRGYRVLTTIALPLVWLLLVQGRNPVGAVVGFLVAVALGWQGPLVYLRRRARLRIEEIDYQMPELIDVLVTTVEAGVGFLGSLQLAARRLQGPLGEELRLTMAEQEMGLSTEDALRNLLDRAETPSVRTFVRAIVQGETLGVSIGKVMRDLAVEMRKRRRQKAEERAQKAPTKMLFPLVFLIFPAMFVVLLGPAVISIIHTLRG
jgi:tight adherence protein C